MKKQRLLRRVMQDYDNSEGIYSDCFVKREECSGHMSLMAMVGW